MWKHVSRLWQAAKLQPAKVERPPQQTRSGPARKPIGVNEFQLRVRQRRQRRNEVFALLDRAHRQGITTYEALSTYVHTHTGSTPTPSLISAWKENRGHQRRSPASFTRHRRQQVLQILDQYVEIHGRLPSYKQANAWVAAKTGVGCANRVVKQWREKQREGQGS